MKLKYGYDGYLYAVFMDEHSAMRWNWLFGRMLKRHSACFNGYFNAYRLLPITD
jgi:putative flippase GtrA